MQVSIKFKNNKIDLLIKKEIGTVKFGLVGKHIAIFHHSLCNLFFIK